MKITIIAGARPNFMKVAPIIKAIKGWNELTGERVNGAPWPPEGGRRDERVKE